MKKWIILFLCSFSILGFTSELLVIDHNDLPSFSNNGNTLKGVATAKLGTTQLEVWKSSIAPGSCTPRHSHDCEELFVFIKGKGKVEYDHDGVVYYEAPCTLVIPMGVEHQIYNTGEEPTEHLVILGAQSKVLNVQGEEMHLPWR